MHRCFFAIRPNNDITKNLLSVIEPYRTQSINQNIHWYPDNNLHITLQFLGSIPESTIQQLIKITKNTCQSAKPFVINMQEIALFPSTEHPKVIAAVGPSINDIERLVDLLGEAAKQCDIKLGKQHFKPHITLGRLNDKSIHDFKSIPLDIELEITNIELLESQTLSEGAVYTRLSLISL